MARMPRRGQAWTCSRAWATATTWPRPGASAAPHRGAVRGCPPCMPCAKALLAQGQAARKPSWASTPQGEVFWTRTGSSALGRLPVTVTTADGSAMAAPGFVTDAMPTEPYTYLYACGPQPMLRAVDGAASPDLLASLAWRSGWAAASAPAWAAPSETRRRSTRRVCREGPVLDRGEVLW